MASKYYDGSGNEITQEEHQRLLINDQRAAINEARLIAEKDKTALEFSRYKQDCRKRALDLAHSHFQFSSRNSDNKDFDIMIHADLYYQWLITIPQ